LPIFAGMTSLGHVLAERRRALGLSLKDLGRLVQNEAKDGKPLSPQFLHDTEHGLRTPGAHLLRELGRVLGVEWHYLAALAGVELPEVVAYLREHPECAPAVVVHSRAAPSSSPPPSASAPIHQ
jgi:transcriptional regulator with XRE-family HTH domain